MRKEVEGIVRDEGCQPFIYEEKEKPAPALAGTGLE
jgi:hypothetical protein